MTSRRTYEALLRRITDSKGELTPLGEQIAEDRYTGEWDEEDDSEDWLMRGRGAGSGPGRGRGGDGER